MRGVLVFPILLMFFTHCVAQDGEDIQTRLIEHQASALNHASNCMNDAERFLKGTPEEAVSIDPDYIVEAKPLWDLLERLRVSSIDQGFFELAEKADLVLVSLPRDRKGFGDVNLCFLLGSQLSDILSSRVAKKRSAALVADERALLVAQSLDIADWLAAGKMTGVPRSLPARRKLNNQLDLDDERIKGRIRALQKAKPAL